VKLNLKAPATAEFPNPYQVQITALSSDSFIVDSYVDAQNGFGALIRSQYHCKMVYDKNKLIDVQDFILQ
jgi:hypothetical protein